MAATPLITWIKTWFDQLDAATQDINNDTIDDILRRHRLIGFERSEAMLNSKDAKVRIDRVTGQITLTLVDIDGTKTNYRHAYQYYLYEGTTTVTVNGTSVTSGFDYHTLSTDLIFSSARSESSPSVKIKGHVLDMHAVMLEYAEIYIMRLSTVPSVRDNEFDKLANRIRSAVNRQFKSKVIRRR